MTADADITPLVEDWRAAGISEGDMVLVHSSTRRTLKRGYSPEQIRDSFLEAVGPKGTVLFPLFNFNFCKGDAFDMRSSKSRMGALTEAARQHPEAVRTGHPAYSFAVLGAEAEAFRKVYNSSGYGTDSPFAMLHRRGGKIAVLDLMGQNSMTFYHYVEEMHRVFYRYHKVFTCPFTDWDGVTGERHFSIYVRDLERGVLTDVNPMDERLWDQGLYSGCRPGEGHGLRVIEARKMFDPVAQAITSGEVEGVLFSYEQK